MAELTLRDYQVVAVQQLRQAVMRSGSAVYCLPTGGGKCLGEGTPVLRFDGQVVPVESIRPGDLLMGPDSQPRQVLSTTSGYGPMAEIRPIKGDPWRCNDVHVLTLQRIRSPKYPSQQEALIDIPVNEYIAKSRTFKRLHKLIRTEVEWRPQAAPLPLDPYFLGLLLGDGTITRGRVGVTTEDPEIVAAAREQAEAFGLRLRTSSPENRTPTWYLTQTHSAGGRPNPIAQALRGMMLSGRKSGEKFVPWAYKVATRTERLELLAGLMDTDGSLHHGGFDYVSKSKWLANDAAFLARSLGLRAVVAPKVVNDTRYWRVSVSGDCSVVPTRIPRKQAPKRRQVKNVLRTGFDIVPVGDDTYYGFELDGDGRFLLGDFTITHNTHVAVDVGLRTVDKGGTVMFLVHRRELVQQAVDKLAEIRPDLTVGVEANGWPTAPWAQFQIGSIASVLNRPHIRHPDVVVIDEAHHARARTWEQVLKRWYRAKRIGLTATPERLDGKGLGEHFAEMVLGPSIPDLVAAGHLAPTHTLTVPAGLMYGRPTEMREQAKGKVIAKAADAYVKYAMGKRAIFFGVHVEHSKQVVAELCQRGVRAAHVDGKDSTARRDRIMREFRTGGIDVVGNCELISEGFDAPACEVVLLGAPTRSVTSYLQKAGRPMRPGPNKTALAIDLAGISHELGLPDDVREWSLEDGEITEKSKTPERPKECPKCASMFRGRVCPWCKYQAPMAKIRETETELVQARRTMRPLTGRRADLWNEINEAKRSYNPRKALLEIEKRRQLPPGFAAQILAVWEQQPLPGIVTPRSRVPSRR